MIAPSERSAEAWEVAERVCTARELQALRLYDQGLGFFRIGAMLGIATSTARSRVERAIGKIERERGEG